MERIIDSTGFFQAIENRRDAPFVWGQNDCVTFANYCMWAGYKRGFCDDWVGQYHSAAEAFRYYRKRLHDAGVSGLGEELDKRMKRIPFGKTGSVVGRAAHKGGVADLMLGVVSGPRAVFIGLEGLVFSPILEGDSFWQMK